MLKKIRAIAGKINNINHINAGASLPTVTTLCMNLTNHNVMPQTGLAALAAQPCFFPYCHH